MTDIEFIAGSVKMALADVNNNVVKLASIEGSIKHNSSIIAHLVCDLADIHENLKYSDLDNKISEIEKINKQIQVLAEARAYMTRFEKIAEMNTEQ